MGMTGVLTDLNNDEMPVQELEQAWARRAAQIAQSIEQEDQGEQIELAIIRLGRELYGLEVQYVFDIRPLESITRVPRTPEWVAGIVNLRGSVISVLDLRRYMGMPSMADNGSSEPAKAHLVEVKIPEMELALLIDEVLAIETIPLSKIQEAAGAVRDIPSEFIRGIIVRGESSSEQTSATSNGRHGSPSLNHNGFGKNGNGSPDNPKGTVTRAAIKNGNGSNGQHANSQASSGITFRQNEEAKEGSNSTLVILDLPALLSDKRLIIHEEVL